MWCEKCKNDLSNCTCSDIDERLAKVAKSPHFVFRVCFKCGKHYARCKCKYPKWGISTELKNKIGE